MLFFSPNLTGFPVLDHIYLLIFFLACWKAIQVSSPNEGQLFLNNPGNEAKPTNNDKVIYLGVDLEFAIRLDVCI